MIEGGTDLATLMNKFFLIYVPPVTTKVPKIMMAVQVRTYPKLASQPTGYLVLLRRFVVTAR